MGGEGLRIPAEFTGPTCQSRPKDQRFARIRG